MMSFTIRPHAMRRYFERVIGVDFDGTAGRKVTDDEAVTALGQMLDMAHAEHLFLTHMTGLRKRVSKRGNAFYRGDFVTFVVDRQNIVRTVLPEGRLGRMKGAKP